MFTWICPTCGREVPPSYDECPDCAAKAKSGEPPAQAAAPPAPVSAPAAAAPPTPAAYAPPPGTTSSPAATPPYAHPPAHAALPTWLLTILFAFAFFGLGAGVYGLVHYFGGGSQAASAPADTSQAKGPVKESPFQKYVEVGGIRFVDGPKGQIEARFVVVNHSGADVVDLAGNVTIWGRAGKSEEAAGSFSFKLPSLGPYESKEATAPVISKLKAYELPDWQFITTDVRITSP
jgi:hypothetical protein